MLRTINIEETMPSIAQARAQLASELRAARQEGAPLLKIIHGYGSSGVGGDLRIALQATLRQMEEQGEIRACIFGEKWHKGDERTWELLKRYPALKADRDLGKSNRGITIIVL
ncbi:MAG TPA: Smr/MutS family protein [Candidatus Angelobacter sp.]|nr:Smr/MutS family protein [Candidatus Angelobacter sp.]